MRTKSILLSLALLSTVACSSKPTEVTSSPIDNAASEENPNYTANPRSERAPASEIAGGWNWNSDTANYSNDSWGGNNWGDNDWFSQPPRYARYRRSGSSYARPRHRRFPQSSTCSAQGAAAWIVKIGQATHSSHQCLSAVRAAYGGCSPRVISAIHSYQHGMNSMRRAGWRCGYTHNPYEAPEGAVIALTNHVEIRVGRCFYSDFHVVNCKPATRYSHNPRHMYGWCMP